MTPRRRRSGSYVMFCVGLLWAGEESLYGGGANRVLAIAILIMDAMTIASVIFDRVRPRPKRRRARERDTGG